MNSNPGETHSCQEHNKGFDHLLNPQNYLDSADLKFLIDYPDINRRKYGFL